MNIKNWLIRTYLKFKFLRDKKQAPQERVEKLLNPIELHKDLMDDNEPENVINLETGASDETWLQHYLSLGK